MAKQAQNRNAASVADKNALLDETNVDAVRGEDTRTLLAKVSSALQGNYETFWLTVGYCLALFPFNWALSAAAVNPDARSFNFNLIIDIGELVGCLCICLIVFARWQTVTRAWFKGCALGCMALGCLIIALQEVVPLLHGIVIVGDSLVGFGYAITLVLWLMVLAMLPPRKMLLVVSVGFLFNLAAYPVVEYVPILIGAIYSLGCVLISTAVLIMVDKATALSATTHTKITAGINANLKRPTFLKPSWRLLLFSSVIPFAYGWCTNYLAVGVSSLGLKLGFALPALIIVVGMIVNYREFNLTTVFGITCPLMIVGLLATVLLSLPTLVTKTFIASALGSVFLVMYVMVRVQSRMGGVEVIPAYALLISLITFTTQVGKALENATHNQPWESYLLVAMVVATAGVFLLLITGSRESSSDNLRKMLSDENESERMASLAERYGLSQREVSVYLLLLQDKSVNDIASELFIAPSTVRAHISRIYDKFGVHSRQEFFRVTRG